MTGLTESEWMTRGYNRFTAEALEDLELTPVEVASMSVEELLEKVCSWQGIQGYAFRILDTIKVLRQKGHADV